MTEQTLLLNASYEPLDVLHWQRAMVLWAQGKVEIVETHEREVRSVSFSFKLPSVVRLFRFVRVTRRPVVQFTRANIYTRDHYTCQYCGASPDTPELTFDHVVPVAQGGTRGWENIVTCCIDCNRKKGSRTPSEANMTLRKTPMRPNYSSIFRATVGIRQTPKTWVDYLYWHVTIEDTLTS